MGLSENVGYIPNYSHLIGIMISKTIGFRGTNHFQTHPISLNGGATIDEVTSVAPGFFFRMTKQLLTIGLGHHKALEQLGGFTAKVDQLLWIYLVYGPP